MVNTGYLYFYAHESAYNRYRRFLIANGGRCFTLEELKSICREKGIDTDSYLYSGRHLSVSLINEIIVKELETTRAIRAYLPEQEKKGYKPAKHCSDCSKIGYHSRLFDLDWLQVCPFHNTYVTDYCLCCGGKWPSLAQLSKTECIVCGVSNYTDSLIRNGFYDEHNLSSSFEELHQLSKLLESSTPKLRTLADYPGSMFQKRIPPAINNSNIAISASTLAQLNILNLAKASILKKNGLPRLELNALTLNKENFDTCSIYRREYDFNELVALAVSELSKELSQLENTKCPCKNKEKTCSFHIAWLTWLNFIGWPNSFYRGVHCVNSTINRKEIFNYCRNLDLPRPYLQIVADYWQINVPKDLSEILFVEDLKNLYLHIFSYVCFVSRMVREDPGISKYDVERNISNTFFAPNLSATLPIRAHRFESLVDVFWPRVDLAGDLSGLQNIIENTSCIDDIPLALSRRW